MKKASSTVTLLGDHREQAKLLADWNRKASCIWPWSTAGAMIIAAQLL